MFRSFAHFFKHKQNRLQTTEWSLRVISLKCGLGEKSNIWLMYLQWYIIM